jgi:hypothetical protein
MKFVLLLLVCLCLSCVSSNVVIVKSTDSYFIENWQKNGVKIIKIDTLKNGTWKVYTK